MKPMAPCVILVSLLLSGSVASAATCTITGTYLIQSLDSYHCDNSVLPTQCIGYVEQDLATNDRPMKYMFVSFHEDNSSKTHITSNSTNINGVVTASFTRTTCPDTIIAREWLLRTHESDGNSAFPRLRFAVQKPIAGDPIWTAEHTYTRSGNSYTRTVTHLRSVNPTSFASAANVYYTANSAISQMIGWHTRLNDYWLNTFAAQASVFRFVYANDTVVDAGGLFDGTDIHIDKDDYNWGALIRHEIGHAAHWALHGKDASNNWNYLGNCHSYMYGNVAGHGPGGPTCEWGATATMEGIASFLGIRSSMINESIGSVWVCDTRDNSNINVCSDLESTINGIPDRIGGSTGIGDTYAWNSSHCPRVRPGGGCNTCVAGVCTPCPDANSDGICDDYVDLGFRNEVNTVRFLWDLIDYNNETGDDTDRSIVDLANGWANMSCSSSSGGIDATCNEPHRTVGNCSPVSTTGDVPATGNGTRDSYNMRDLSVAFNTGLTQELDVNCGVQALDEP